MVKLRKKVIELTARRAPETRRAYACDLRDFETWCSAAGRAQLPALPETVQLYVVHSFEVDKRSIATVRRRLASIGMSHRACGASNPVNETVRAVVSGLCRAGAKPSAGKAAITVPNLRAMVKACPRTPLGVRDRALLLLGFASGMRRSELSGLDLVDVTITARGIRVVVRRSKTDQEGRGREIGIFPGKKAVTDPVRALRAWLNVRGRDAGPLFFQCDGQSRIVAGERLVGGGVWDAVKRCANAAGLDATQFGAHSLRAGCITAAAEAGVPESLIMQRTGHRSIATVAKYVRPAQIWSYDALARVL